MNEAVIRAIASEIAALPTRNAYGNDETYVEVITTTISKYLPIEQRKWSCSKCGNVSVGDACLKCESKAGTLFYPDADDLSASVPDSAFTPKHLGFPEQSPRVCIKCGHGGTPKGERCTFGYIGPDVDAGCGCQCEFPANPSITDQ